MKNANYGNPLFIWDMRMNEDYATDEQLRSLFSVIAKKWCFQLEEGEGGYRHWQIRVDLHKKTRKGQIMDEFERAGIKPPNYIAPTAVQGDNFSYVMKVETRLRGPWMDNDTADELYVPKKFRITEEQLLPWQKKLVDIIKTPDDRTVHYIYCPGGSIGKSFLCGYMCTHKLAIKLPPVNNAKELLRSVYDILHSKREREPKVVFIDMPRAQDETKVNSIYKAIEDIKNGYSYDMRYHYKEWCFEPPSVVVFANFLPYFKHLSRDRWKVMEIGEDLELKVVTLEQINKKRKLAELGSKTIETTC